METEIANETEDFLINGQSLNELKVKGLVAMLSIAYSLFLRSPLIKFIDDPEANWDDKVIQALDILFGYKR